MLLGEILREEAVRTALTASDKFDAIEELIDLLVSAGDLSAKDRHHALDIVSARERSMGTGMEQGIALPHGASDRITRAVCALGISRDGISFDSLDGEPAHLILLLIVPQSKFQARVRTLAGVSHLLNEPAFRDALMAARTPGDIVSLIQDEERDPIFDPYRK